MCGYFEKNDIDVVCVDTNCTTIVMHYNATFIIFFDVTTKHAFYGIRVEKKWKICNFDGTIETHFFFDTIPDEAKDDVKIVLY